MRCLTHRVAALVAFAVLTLPATAAAQGVAGVTRAHGPGLRRRRWPRRFPRGR